MVFLLSFLIMGLIMAGMALGAMTGRGALKGSCGGLSAVGIEGRCDICGDDPNRCETNSEQNKTLQDSDTEFYDATK